MEEITSLKSSTDWMRRWHGGRTGRLPIYLCKDVEDILQNYAALSDTYRDPSVGMSSLYLPKKELFTDVRALTQHAQNSAERIRSPAFVKQAYLSHTDTLLVAGTSLHLFDLRSQLGDEMFVPGYIHDDVVRNLPASTVRGLFSENLSEPHWVYFSALQSFEVLRDGKREQRGPWLRIGNLESLHVDLTPE